MLPDDEKIRQRAYEIWEREGRPEGREAEHWQKAVEELRAGSSLGAASQEVPAARMRGPAQVDERREPSGAAGSVSGAAGAEAGNAPAAPSPDPQSDPLGLAQPTNKPTGRKRNGPARGARNRMRPDAAPSGDKTPDRTR